MNSKGRNIDSALLQAGFVHIKSTTKGRMCTVTTPCAVKWKWVEYPGNSKNKLFFVYYEVKGDM